MGKTFDWCMTEPHPWKRSHTHGADAGRVGWRWHAVALGEDKRPVALCGLRPAHGWGADLFADEMCERCRVKALKQGIPLPSWLRRSIPASYKEQRRARS